MSTQYYCGKCQHNHKYTSKIGQKHLKYKEDSPITPEQGNELDTFETVSQEESLINPENPDQISARTDKTTRKMESDISAEIKIDEDLVVKPPSNRIVRFIRDYQRSYQKGIEKFGVWWKVFQISIWSIVMIFIIMACIIFVLYLPKIDMINWIIR